MTCAHSHRRTHPGMAPRPGPLLPRRVRRSTPRAQEWEPETLSRWQRLKITSRVRKGFCSERKPGSISVSKSRSCTRPTWGPGSLAPGRELSFLLPGPQLPLGATPQEPPPCPPPGSPGPLRFTALRTRLSRGLRLGSLVDERMPVPQLLASVFLAEGGGGSEAGPQHGLPPAPGQLGTPGLPRTQDCARPQGWGTVGGQPWVEEAAPHFGRVPAPPWSPLAWAGVRSGRWGLEERAWQLGPSGASGQEDLPVKEGGEQPAQQYLVLHARAQVAVHELAPSDAHA